MKLPESLYFLRPGWWLVHLVGASAVFAAGFVASHHVGDDGEHVHGHVGSDATHVDHHDHSSSEGLRLVMQRMLVDTVQLQGALAEGDLAGAAAHADAIAVACEQDDDDEGALPDRLGPSFLEHDRELHRTASRLGEALRSGRRRQSLALSRDMVSTCRACHTQAPAASEVDVQVLVFFADTLMSADGATP